MDRQPHDAVRHVLADRKVASSITVARLREGRDMQGLKVKACFDSGRLKGQSRSISIRLARKEHMKRMPVGYRPRRKQGKLQGARGGERRQAVQVPVRDSRAEFLNWA